MVRRKPKEPQKITLIKNILCFMGWNSPNASDITEKVQAEFLEATNQDILSSTIFAG
jgi:hypothetical protein